MAKKKSKILSAVESVLPFDDIKQLVVQLLAGGVSSDEICDEVAAIVDKAVNWSVVLPPPLGVIVEAGDGLVADIVAKCIVAAVQHERKKAGS